MRKRKPSGRVREPVQVYLDPADRALLDQVAQATGQSRAEVLRRGLRALAGRALAERTPGWSLHVLADLLPEAPPDLAERHDDYLAAALDDAPTPAPLRPARPR